MANTSTSETSKGQIAEWLPWALMVGVIGVGFAGSMALRSLSVHALAAPSPASARTVATASAAASDPLGPTISVLYLCVAHKDTKLGAHLHITRTKEEAHARAEEALARVRKGEDFGKILDEYSDIKRNNDARGIDNFRRGDVMGDFGNVAFALKPGQVSDVVDTVFGYDVILRTK